MAHEVSNFLDSIKESLTDAQYKEGMETCQKLFEATEIKDKLYRMTYLRPYTFMDEHCHDEECDEMKFYVSFEKATSLVKLNDERVKRIMATNLFLGTDEQNTRLANITHAQWTFCVIKFCVIGCAPFSPSNNSVSYVCHVCP